MTFPQQSDDFSQIASRVQKALDANQLAIKVDGELFVIPMNNIKYLQVNPAPRKATRQSYSRWRLESRLLDFRLT
jgi:hypothetical protein